MTSKIKTAISILTMLVFTAMLIGSSSSKSRQTTFDTYQDAKKYVRYESYSDLVKLWGEPSSIGKPYLSSDNSMYEVSVIWNNVRVEGEPMEIYFQNYPVVIRNDGSVQTSPGMKPLRIQVGSTGYGW